MCYSPLYAWKYDKKDFWEEWEGEVKQGVYICKNQYEGFSRMKREFDFTVPCGKCAECLYQRSLEWSYRIMLESKDYLNSCFITLTYKDDPVQLIKSDYQKFLKRLRKKIGKFRYFLCGEYGSKGKRPHFHAIIFGYWPKDAEKVINPITRKETDYWKSKELEEIWGLGFVSVGELTQYDAKYCAKYMQKLQAMSDEFVQPFVAMSTHPGLGFKQFEEHKEAYLKSDKIYFQGNYIKLPRYFLNNTLKGFPEFFDDYLNLKEHRQIRADLVPNTDANFAERKKKYIKLLKKC